jgi:hypothetical protein
VFKNNIFYKNAQTIFLGFPDYKTKNRNCFFNNVMLGTAPGQQLIRLDRGDDYTLAEAQAQLPDLYKGNIESNPMLVDEAGDDFRLREGSPCIDQGADLTRTADAGTGTEVVVDDALYFCDGFGMIQGDEVVIGANRPARITNVDYEKNLLTLDRAISWEKGDRVNLPYVGAGPDIGPHESGAR